MIAFAGRHKQTIVSASRTDQRAMREKTGFPLNISIDVLWIEISFVIYSPVKFTFVAALIFSCRLVPWQGVHVDFLVVS